MEFSNFFLDKYGKRVKVSECRFYRMHLGRQARANSVDPGETPQNAASHQGLHCLPLIQQFLDNMG